jgi:hypothetical protein
MRYLYSAILGLALGVSSVFVYGMYPPIGLLLSIAATCLGIWAVGRLWGKRIYRYISAVVWIHRSCDCDLDASLGPALPLGSIFNL